MGLAPADVLLFSEWPVARLIANRACPEDSEMRSAPVLDTDTPEFEAPVEAAQAPVGIARRVGAFLLRELREMLPPTIFFFVGFQFNSMDQAADPKRAWDRFQWVHYGHICRASDWQGCSGY